MSREYIFHVSVILGFAFYFVTKVKIIISTLLNFTSFLKNMNNIKPNTSYGISQTHIAVSCFNWNSRLIKTAVFSIVKFWNCTGTDYIFRDFDFNSLAL